MAVEAGPNKQALEAFRRAVESGDMEQVGAVQRQYTHPDFVQEWPQSGERIRGQENVKAVNDQYGQATGTSPRMNHRRTSASGDLAVVEGTIDYGDGTPVSYIGIAEFRDGKIIRMTEYYANPFEAPEWRKPYVERMD